MLSLLNSNTEPAWDDRQCDVDGGETEKTAEKCVKPGYVRSMLLLEMSTKIKLRQQMESRQEHFQKHGLRNEMSGKQKEKIIKDLETYRRKRESNKLSSKKLRDKKKNELKGMMRKRDVLATENHQKRLEIRALRREIGHLKAMIDEHPCFNVPDQTQWVYPDFSHTSSF